MRAYRLHKFITVSATKFVLEVTLDYELMFGLIRGVHQDNTTVNLYDIFGDDTSSTEIFGVKDPIKSCRAEIEKFIDYIHGGQAALR